MQVSQTQDHINHAIIGGGASIDFGISSSPEFFHLLSSTLYRDQILAVVREVMCNAWDAHIEAGCQDRPIEITIDNETFMVTDHGLGIHHDDMGPIYGVYGNSTKKNDGAQTGGFGLGCKSPFAYTDHFEVTSCHEGVKTIYRLSKSVVQNGSKPGIVPIASFPSEESGLTVKIALKSPSDRRRFQELANRIAFNGEMLAEINKEPVAKLGFDSTVRNYHVYRGLQLLDDSESLIQIRYGNVIYPVESCKELQAPMKQIQDFLSELNPYVYGKVVGYKILFQAPPDSLSVTPSRESLSMQEHTIKTLQNLFNGFIDEVGKTFPAECDNFSQAAIETAVEQKAYHLLLSRGDHLPIVKKNENLSVLPDFKTMAEQYLSITYPNDLAFRKADWKCRVMLMSQKGLINRGLAQTWLRDADLVTKLESGYWSRSAGEYPWLARRVIAPLLGKLTLAEGMNPNKLYAVDDADRGHKKNTDCIPAPQVSPRHHFTTAAYLRNIIVLSRRKKDIYERAIQHGVFQKFGKTAGFLFYHVGLKADDATKARAFFAKTGMNVVDMIERQDWEEYTAPTSQQPANSSYKPRKKGLVKVSYLGHDGIVNVWRWQDEDAERIEKPEYVVRVYTGSRENQQQLGTLNSLLTREFIRLFGERGAVSANDTQYANYIWKKGAITQIDFLVKEVLSYFAVSANKATLQKYWACHYERVINDPRLMGSLDYAQQQTLKAIYRMPKLADHFKVSYSLQDLDKSYLAFYKHLTDICRTGDRYPEFHALQKEVSKIPLDPAHKLLMDKISKSKLLPMLADELDSLYRMLEKNNVPAQLDKFVEIITTVLDN